MQLNIGKEKNVIDFCTSTVGRKYFMGFSGLIWAGFLFTHMAGNLLIFVSPDAYNSYGHAITSGKLIYIVEALLVGTLLLHIFLALALTLKNRAARPQGYAKSAMSSKGSTLASKSMAIHGLFILVFIVLHLLTFKYGTTYETLVDGVSMRDLHRLIIEVFQQPIYVIWYIVCLILLGMHLSHGISSLFQSFGLLHPAYQAMIKKLSYFYAAVVAGGFISQPLYVFYVYFFAH